MPNFPPKRRWPDGDERICDGAIVTFSSARGCGSSTVVNELPKEVFALMEMTHERAMLVLHHHADPSVEVYVRCEDVIAIDARWSKVEPDA